MECRRGSLRLDVRRADHLAPLLGFVGNELSEVGGRARMLTFSVGPIAAQEVLEGWRYRIPAKATDPVGWSGGNPFRTI